MYAFPTINMSGIYQFHYIKINSLIMQDNKDWNQMITTALNY